jgi:hypothetical protein
VGEGRKGGIMKDVREYTLRQLINIEIDITDNPEEEQDKELLAKVHQEIAIRGGYI